MTTPFGQFFFSDENIDGAGGGQTDGGTGDNVNNTGETIQRPSGECTIGGFDCPPGTVCQFVESGVTAFGIPVFTSRCVQVSTTTSQGTGTGTSTGGTGTSTSTGGTGTSTANCISEGGACGGIVIGGCCTGLFCDGGNSENIGVCTRTTTTTSTTVTNNTAGLCQANADCGAGRICNLDNPTFPTGDLTNPFGKCVNMCNYTDVTIACSVPASQGGPGLSGYTGLASRTTVVKNSLGQSLPLGCVENSNMETSWDTSPCVPPGCNYKPEKTQCSNLPGFERYTGDATRTVLETNTNGQALPLGCVQNEDINQEWDTKNCTPPSDVTSTPCELKTEFGDCGELFGFNYVNPVVNGVVSRPSRKRFNRINGVLTPAGCIVGNQVETDWDVQQCVRRTIRVCGTSTDITGLIQSQQELVRDYESSTDASGACVRLKAKWRECSDSAPTQADFKNVSDTPIPTGFVQLADNFGTCYDRGWRECGNNVVRSGTPFNNYIFNQQNQCWYAEEIIVDSDTCIIPPSTRTRDINCTSIDSKYIGGVAKQTQVRGYNPDGPAGRLCPYIGEWEDSGTPDVSLCQLSNVIPPTAAPPNIVQTCTPPSGQSTRQINIPCSTVDRKYSNGNAIQTQIRRYDASAAGPGECPFTWENEGQPDVTSCTMPIFWRNCVTGQLVEGNAPIDFIQVNYNGAGGGTCWEPIQEIGFEPSLNEALRYSYQRGSKKYPQSKNIKITNPSYGIAYRITFTTNTDIKLINGSTSGNGTITFVLTPRTSETLGINITPTLLEKLQDGLSSLSMSVEYERIIE